MSPSCVFTRPCGPARRRRTQPSLPPAEPPDPPEPPVETEEMVTCFLSGERVPKRDAVLIRIGPNKTMWMMKTLTNQG